MKIIWKSKLDVSVTLTMKISFNRDCVTGYYSRMVWQANAGNT